MAKAQDRFLKARLVPEREAAQQRLAAVAPRPLRLAFIIKDDIAQEQLLKLFQYNCLVWGGYYNLMVPTNGQSIRKDWLTSLVNHDPDLLLVCGDISTLLVDEIFEKVQPFYIWSWSNDILDKHLEDEETIGSLPIHHILTHLYLSNRPVTNSNIRIPKVNPSSSYYFQSLAQFGASL